MRMFTAALGAALLTLGAAAPATAQDAAKNYPSQPVRLLVPYAPGGAVDVAARIIAHALSERWGQQVVVDNRPGGRGYLATSVAAKATPDGYTLLMAHTGEFAVNPVMFNDVPYDLERDFEPITMVNDAPLVVGVYAKAPYNTMKDLIDAAKKKPGSIEMATPGIGTINYLTGAWIELESGVKFLHVPYKGGAPAAAAAGSGEVAFGVAALSSNQPQIDGKMVRVLAVSTPERTHVDKSWPTLKESGLNITSSIWTGLFAPKGVPKEIVDKIYRDAAAALKSEDVQARFRKGGSIVGGMPPEAFKKRILDESNHFRSIAKRAGIKTH